MESLPPVALGAHILTAFAVALVLRHPLERRLVTAAPEIDQSARQFMLDQGLGAVAALVAAGLNHVRFGFPAGSTISLILGVMFYTFFVALDTALAREHATILKVAGEGRALPVPRRLFPMTRRFTLVAVATAVCVSVVNVLVIARDMSWLTTIGDDPAARTEAILSVTAEVLFVMAVMLGLAVNLIVSYSRNLKLLFRNETTVLEQVTRGDLSRMVPVATRDEFGLIAGHTNTMIEGLRHRTELISALKLAEEVQRTLLPAGPPQLDGVEVAGTSIYCNETGGDYYDYFALPGGRLGVAVADVAGHGVDAALFMASARAFIHAEAQGFSSPSTLARDVNRYVARDCGPTGRFMSLFFLEIDPALKTMRWVRAGHEPALMFEPGAGDFRELGGEGMALGVADEVAYRDYALTGWEPGAVVVIGTDGITESRSPAGELFGAARVRELVRANAHLPAERIQAAVIRAVEQFRADGPQEDDITLVVVKLA
ncbi:MAG TPA: SpoIIE family protein phosphatase [Desulfobacterales bacterium]|nr:SpoIIE family protein phosphatase [Desulfobacterales bacterium]